MFPAQQHKHVGPSYGKQTDQFEALILTENQPLCLFLSFLIRQVGDRFRTNVFYDTSVHIWIYKG